jgi:DUF4097 and DUF4098 domain-containing protein YvlB
MRIKTVSLVLLAAPFLAASAQENVFSGQIASGSWLRLRTPHGDITVNESSGNTVTVSARQHRGRDDDAARFDVQRDGNSVTVCAIIRQTRKCDSDENEVRWTSGRDMTSVDFTVSLPKGVKLLAATGNGDVDIRGAGSDVLANSGNGQVRVNGASGYVEAHSGNGDIRVDRAGDHVEANTGNGDIIVTTARGPVSAHSGNGRIEVEMAALSGGKDNDMDFTTGNGSIEISLPSNLDAQIDANVSRNGFDTDFPIQMPGGWSSQHVRGTIGNGGSRIRLSTGNGHISLRKNRQTG